MASKWRNMSKKDKGKQYQPDTWATCSELYLQHSGQRELHLSIPKTLITVVPLSPTEKPTGKYERNQYNKFDPFSTSDGPSAYTDRLNYAVFVLGRYWLLRGHNE